MCNLFRPAVLGLLVTLSYPSAAHSQPQETRVVIKMYNYAGIPGDLLARAGQRAAHVFRRAGIHSIWLDCPFLERAAAAHPVCSEPPAATILTLKLLPGPMSARFNQPAHVFGLAVLTENGDPALVAYVFYDRVEEMTADHPRINPAVVLGHVAAHEIGHLLLGTNSHTLTGIMTADWFGKNLLQAAQGTLLFSREQCEQLRLAVAIRQASGAQPEDPGTDRMQFFEEVVFNHVSRGNPYIKKVNRRVNEALEGR